MISLIGFRFSLITSLIKRQRDEYIRNIRLRKKTAALDKFKYGFTDHPECKNTCILIDDKGGIGTTQPGNDSTMVLTLLNLYDPSLDLGDWELSYPPRFYWNKTEEKKFIIVDEILCRPIVYLIEQERAEEICNIMNQSHMAWVMRKRTKCPFPRVL